MPETFNALQLYDCGSKHVASECSVLISAVGFEDFWHVSDIQVGNKSETGRGLHSDTKCILEICRFGKTSTYARCSE